VLECLFLDTFNIYDETIPITIQAT